MRCASVEGDADAALAGVSDGDVVGFAIAENEQRVAPRKALGVPCLSKAPISTLPPKMRANPGPRWSVVVPAGTSGLLPALIAWLPNSSAWVWVGPPLLASGPKFGSPLIVSARPPLPSSIRLCEPVMVPNSRLRTSAPSLLATIELFRISSPRLPMAGLSGSLLET